MRLESKQQYVARLQAGPTSESESESDSESESEKKSKERAATLMS
jgi:hypothetical protein